MGAGGGLGQLRWVGPAARGSKPSAAGTSPADRGEPERSLLTCSAGVMATTRPSPSSRDPTPLPGQPTASLDHLPPERLGPGKRPAAARRALSLAFPLVLRQNSFGTRLTLFQRNPGNRPHLGRRSRAVSVCQTPVRWQGLCVLVRVGPRRDVTGHSPGTLPVSPRPLGPARPIATRLLT